MSCCHKTRNTYTDQQKVMVKIPQLVKKKAQSNYMGQL